ncbi:2062_t:CDS:2, partial [Dentiscutata heterogama]
MNESSRTAPKSSVTNCNPMPIIYVTELLEAALDDSIRIIVTSSDN